MPNSKEMTPLLGLWQLPSFLMKLNVDAHFFRRLSRLYFTRTMIEVTVFSGLLTKILPTAVMNRTEDI